jgi:hypothetical protein
MKKNKSILTHVNDVMENDISIIINGVVYEIDYSKPKINDADYHIKKSIFPTTYHAKFLGRFKK